MDSPIIDNNMVDFEEEKIKNRNYYSDSDELRDEDFRSLDSE